MQSCPWSTRTGASGAPPGNSGAPIRVVHSEMGKQFEEFEDGGVVLKYRRHSNGRGLVAMTAKADPTAYVAPTAYIEADSRVAQDGRMGEGGWIGRDPRVGRGSILGAKVHIGPGSVSGRGAKIGSH